MEIKEITSSLSAVVPIGAYENLKPGFEIRAELAPGDDVDKAFKILNDRIKCMLESFSNRAKADLIEKQFTNIRMYDKNDKKYPSVTSILGWAVDWKMSESELAEYAARGTMIHKLIEHRLDPDDGKWYDPLEVPELEKYIATLKGGARGLTWENCSYKKAVEALIGDLKVLNQEVEIFNDTHLFAGRADLVGLYKGKLSVIDFKTGTTADMRQLAAYASCLEGIEQLMIVPVGPTDNKSGVKKPVISTDIEGEFKKFLYARAAFRERFGI